MKVLLVDPSLYTPPYDGALAAALAERGHAVLLAGRRPRASDPPLGGRVDVAPVFYGGGERWRSRLPAAVSRALKGVEHGRGLVDLAALADRFRADVVHWQWPSLPVLDAVALRRMSRSRPQIVTVHDRRVFKAKTGLRRLQSLGWTRFLQVADELIVHVPSTREELHRLGVTAHPVSVVPHPVFERMAMCEQPSRSAGGTPERPQTDDACGMDRSGSGDARRPGGDSATPLRVSFFGRLSDDKGVDVLADALARLAAADLRRLRVRVYGRPIGEDRRVAAALATLRRLDGVDLRTDYLPEDALDALLADSDLVVLPHREVDASGMLMKALAYDVGLVVADVPAFREVLGVAPVARFFASEDAGALADALCELAHDPVKVDAMRAAASALRGGALSWSNAAEATERIYERALAARRASAATVRARATDVRRA
jgi:glycosyltransferase involved in cell wall biosynthesis